MRFSSDKTKQRKRISAVDAHGVTRAKSKNLWFHSKKHRYSAAFGGGFVLLFITFSGLWLQDLPRKAAAADTSDEIENAIFTRQEFFGSQATVRLPTAEAREKLVKLLENSPDSPQILEKLAELNEQLRRDAEAENNLQRLAEIDGAKLENLAAFYERRAQFEKQAAILKKILLIAAVEKRGAAFEKLLNTARRHDLREYLQPAFYSEIAGENTNVYPVFARLIVNLEEEGNYAEALNFVRQARRQFPERQSVLLQKEVALLLEAKNLKEAEEVYTAAFDPFWTETEAQKFYDFLNDQDRLRAYGTELKARFKKNPADFDAGIRFALYQNHDYSYGNDSIAPVILKLETAKKTWTTAELVTVSRLLLRAGEADLAARFLYTLYLREDFKSSSDSRAKILYQLFEMFSDAESRRLPLTKGDLRFYEDVACADTNPGIATGILSLVFSDADAREKFDEQTTKADKLYNRAAAFRIFEEYKRENPASTELAQMYLDIVRLYTATKEPQIAEEILNEFAADYENSSDYAAAALKLADAYTAVKNEEKARQVYQKTLDYLGKQSKFRAAEKLKDSTLFDESGAENYETKPPRNDGIAIPDDAATPRADYYYNDRNAVFRDYLDRQNDAVTYEEVLEKFVASLAGEKKTADILALYSNEIVKYPAEEWLYEQRLAWLEQTNLTAEQLDVYKTALARFQTNDWRDRLARFFVRNRRNDEFARFSEELVGKLNDTDTRDFLAEFARSDAAATAFEKSLSLKLYQSAHARFPHNVWFTSGLLRFYESNKQANEWRALAAEYYFESPEIREEFLDELARTNRLRDYFEQSKNRENTIYKLFRADSAARLSDFENSVAAYRQLNELYPNTPEFANRLINFTRSFGQKNRQSLGEAAAVSNSAADFRANSAEQRTRTGEIYAELGDYEKARQQWQQLIGTARGEREIYLDTATVYWDYFQYEDALQTIKHLREKFADRTLYAFETGAILEAEHREIEAVGEYVKAFDARRDETQKEKAIKRLVTLANRRKPLGNETDNANNQPENAVAAAFSREAAEREDAAFLSLGYAEYLARRQQMPAAAKILNRAVGKSSSKEFLEAARAFYQTQDDAAGAQTALARLAETEQSPRRMIAYRLQLAASLTENQQRERAKSVLEKLGRQFPTNYGVLTETSDFYHRLGFENESARVLENALPASRGAYRSALAQKLAARLIQLDRLASAEQILANLHAENRSDTEIFAELARVYVRTNKPAELRKAFAETVSELQKSDADRRETDAQIADLRAEMINAFTKLKDYQSAVEQHIEIINREPENEELTEAAIFYVKRYGGAPTLIGYYEKLSAEAFKNYRWNVVLARIYEADNDFEKTLKNYRAAIVNQPEMPELYLAVADIETKRGNYDEALKNIDEVLTITNDEAVYVKKKIELLKKSGRFAEIEAEQAKLPAAEEKKIAVDQFAEAGKLPAAEREKARAMYRAAFEKLLENPLTDELRSADVAGYVQLMRDEEPLDKISENLWILREKLTAIADQGDSTDAGAARQRLAMLDGALVESIGATAHSVGTDDELKNLHDNWTRKIEEISASADRRRIASLLQNLSRRAGFGDLEEMILRKNLDSPNADTSRELNFRSLVNFYNERGAYQKTLDALEKYGSGDLPLRAETAKLVGNREKELAALRFIYWNKERLAGDEYVTRYLNVLSAENPDELRSLTEKNSIYQLQLINFLLAKGMRESAHAAIANSNFTAAWKAARNAETSLALREFDTASECFFCDALQFDSIGEMVKQTPDKRRFLINDGWFRLTREYGEWLYEKQDKELAPSKFLTAMIENQPRNADEQFKLGEFYLARGELKSAVEHLRLAVETDASSASDEKLKWATLGVAYFKIGRTDYAADCRARVLADADLPSGAVYFQVLSEYGLSRSARAVLPPIIVKFLQTNNADDSTDFQNLIRRLAASFKDETEKSAYFQAIIQSRPTDTSLAAMLVNENLIAVEEQKPFYQTLISRSDAANGSDYAFASVARRVWAANDAESVFDQENDYETEEPENDRYDWRKKYLEMLVNRRENTAAEQLIAEIEKELRGRYARPAWLRTATIRLAIRAGKFDELETNRFVGIAVSDSAAAIRPPSVTRFNAVRQTLREENHPAEALVLSENFFARMLALGQLNQAHLAGLAQTFFQKNEAEKALNILRLLIAAGDENKKETALAEIAGVDAVKRQTTDAAKIAVAENSSINLPEALKTAAEIAAEYKQTAAAIAFRRQVIELNQSDAANKIELAKLLIAESENDEARNFLTQVINDKNSARQARWQARIILNVEIPNVVFDSLAQFYSGTKAAESNQREAAISFYVNSLIADAAAETSARQELMKLYAAADRPFAALRLAAADQTAKPDELLDALAAAAEKTGDYDRAIEFENAKSAVNTERISALQKLKAEKNFAVTDFKVDSENTRKL